MVAVFKIFLGEDRDHPSFGRLNDRDALTRMIILAQNSFDYTEAGKTPDRKRIIRARLKDAEEFLRFSDAPAKHVLLHCQSR